MKDLISVFKHSSHELKKVSTLTSAGMLIAVSIVIRNFAINITDDLRINFAFIGTMAIAMLFGPAPAMISAAGIDIIGYIMDGFKARDYNILLLIVKMSAALVYGFILYRKESGKKLNIAIIASRSIGTLVFQLIFNSCVLYGCYTNPNFPIMTSPEWDAFFIWITPRIIKNVICLPLECAVGLILLPLIKQAYERVFHREVSVR